MDSTAAIVIVPKIEVTLSPWRHQRPLRTELSSERVRWFLLPLGTETTNMDDFLTNNSMVLISGLRKSPKSPEMIAKKKKHNR